MKNFAIKNEIAINLHLTVGGGLTENIPRTVLVQRHFQVVFTPNFKLPKT